KQQRRKALNEEKRRKRNLKSKGLDQIMENEAEESEDEWQGVGGAEGERSDEEDSEDEKMFDDVTKIKQDRMELAKEIAAEDAQMDQKMLMKILKDLETGNWKRRGGDSADGFDFYDEEDEVMRRYKMYQQSKLREK
ncbi:chromatin-modulating protein MRC1 CYBJADRAFT_114886, partial [Cyberlindnera jadinii NRRL Y-1542]